MLQISTFQKAEERHRNGVIYYKSPELILNLPF